MGAIVLAEPVAETRGSGRRHAKSAFLPALLVAGWCGLFVYCAAYLTEDMPFRPQAAERAGTGTAPLLEAAPRRIVVIDPAEPPASTAPVAVAAAPAVVAPARPTAPAVSQSLSQSAVPAAPARPVPVSAEYVGTWGPTADACNPRSRRRGYIPASITQDRAKAGRTICSFHDGRRAGNAWVVAAECSDRGRRWSSQVRLVVDGDRLTWSSSRGTSAYVRCTRRAG